jgi:hypothetical protein
VRDRRRLSLLPAGLPTEVYHVAQRLAAASAEALIQSTVPASIDTARDSLMELIAEQVLAATDVCVGMIVKRGPPAQPASHSRMSHKDLHASEGELYRYTLIQAVDNLGMNIAICAQGEIEERAFSVLGLSAAELGRRLTRMGEALGPPWTQREKTAALAGWLALKGRSGS